MSATPVTLHPPSPAEPAETALVARAAAGDGHAFETLMRRHNRLLFRAARGIVRDDAEAERKRMEEENGGRGGKREGESVRDNRVSEKRGERAREKRTSKGKD